jgi:hypothetical protein
VSFVRAVAYFNWKNLYKTRIHHKEQNKQFDKENGKTNPKRITEKEKYTKIGCGDLGTCLV